MSNVLLDYMLLGDAYVSKSGRLCMRHAENQLPYLRYKEHIINDLYIKTTVARHSPRDYVMQDGRRYECQASYTLDSTSTTYTKSLRKKFYPTGQKVVPDSIEPSAQGIAIWYMDDGRQNKIAHYNNKGMRIDCAPYVNRYEFCTDSFDNISLTRLIKIFDSFSIETAIQRVRQNQYRIVVRKATAKERLYHLIYPYIIPEMQYKMSLNVFNSKSPSRD